MTWYVQTWQSKFLGKIFLSFIFCFDQIHFPAFVPLFAQWTLHIVHNAHSRSQKTHKCNILPSFSLYQLVITTLPLLFVQIVPEILSFDLKACTISAVLHIVHIVWQIWSSRLHIVHIVHIVHIAWQNHQDSVYLGFRNWIENTFFLSESKYSVTSLHSQRSERR